MVILGDTKMTETNWIKIEVPAIEYENLKSLAIKNGYRYHGGRTDSSKLIDGLAVMRIDDKHYPLSRKERLGVIKLLAFTLLIMIVAFVGGYGLGKLIQFFN